ncbi:hypothetical protein K501DRAFT_256830 [Backusella circina FSU 941]|nr:hypothetical protein K501DRAFT_256830 [Backusella circina FSU 941]
MPNKKYENIHPKSRPAEPCIAIIKLSTQGRGNEALSIYLKLLDDGGFPSSEAQYQLTRSLYKSSNLLGMHALHDTLISYYKTHTLSRRSGRNLIYMYTMLINLICKNTKPVDMNSITHLCKEMADLELDGSIPLYNTLIKLFLDRNQLEDAKSIYNDLLKKGMEPSKETFGILMHYAAKKKDIPQLILYLDEMDRYGIEPDYATMTVIIIALCKTKNIDTAKQLLEDLHSLYAFVNDDYKNTLLKKIERRLKK